MGSLQLNECGRVFMSSDYRLCVVECHHCKGFHTEWTEFLDHIKRGHQNTKDLQQEEAEAGQHDRNEIKMENMEALVAEDQDVNMDDVEFIEESNRNSNENSSEGNSKCFKQRNNELCNKGSNEEVNRSRLKVPQDVITRPCLDGKKWDLPQDLDTCLAFVMELKTKRSLWDAACADYTNLSKRRTALDELASKFNTTPLTIKEYIFGAYSWYKKQYSLHQKKHFPTTMNQKVEDLFKLCSFFRNSKMQFHSRPFVKHPSSRSGIFVCPYCEKDFKKSKYLDVHVRRHTQQHQYKCVYCDKRTITSSEMKTHMRVHTGEKPYKCSTCEKCFKTSSVLCQHQRKHSLPTLQCSLCPKAYYNNYQLKNHMNMHLNRRNYKCEFCEKSYTSAKLLYSHKSLRHKELMPTFCKDCDKCFPNILHHFHMEHVNANAERN